MADTPPKLFISYSWTSPQHKQWVLDLATKLRGNGVDALLDTWDIKEGQDVIKFMEGMVTDSTINKVMMVVDKSYADKADEREGGVGVEAQIISKKIYDNHDQEKFVAIALEKDSEGKLILPVYCKSRMCIDFSDPQNYDEKFEELLRWIFGKPLDVKPALGKKPDFLSDEPNDEKKIDIKTAIPFSRAIEAIEEAKGNTTGRVADYLQTLSVGLEAFRIKTHTGRFDDAVVESIKSFIPYRTEFIKLILTMAKYGMAENCSEALRKFFEGLTPYFCPPKDMYAWEEERFDNFKFIIHELFLYTVAILLKEEKFEAVRLFLSRDYYVKRNVRNDTDLKMSYRVFYNPVRSLKTVNDRLPNPKHSPHAALLNDGAEYENIDFRYLMQADFMLFMRREMLATDWSDRWWPITLLYEVFPDDSTFEIFVRARSIEYFDKIKDLIGFNDRSDINKLSNLYASGTRNPLVVCHHPLNIEARMGFENLATTKP